MRPVLFELGPLPVWALLPIAALMGAFLALWSWLERREEENPRRLTTVDWLVWAMGVVFSSLALFFLINFHYARTHQPVMVRSYGAMLLLAMLAGMAWLGYAGRGEGLRVTQVVDFALYVLVGAILGARIVFVLLDASAFAHDPLSMLRVWEGGLSFHGGLLGGVLGGYLYARSHGRSFGLLANLCAPAVALGYAITRLGCFLNGCCFGGMCDSWMGVRFGPGSEAAAWALHLSPGQVALTPGPPLHPAQLYSSFLGFVIFLFLIWVRPYFPGRGHLFVLFLGLSGVERFIVEFWRHGASGQPFAPLPVLTEAQVFSLVMILGAGLYLILARAPRNEGGKS